MLSQLAIIRDLFDPNPDWVWRLTALNAVIPGN
jgi:hypothetical protein